MNNKHPLIYKSKENCCGCSACYNICPVGAIKMEADDEGFLYPTINEKACIKCNKCINVCNFKLYQQNNGYKNTVSSDCTAFPKVYAVKHKNIQTRMDSRSGGIFTAISDEVLKKNGAIYGCVLTKDFKAVHAKAVSSKNRNKMRGSKYIQSEMNDIFKDVAQTLDKGTLVLFTGTSCQIAGLKSFLNKEYDNLLCVDIVCHGVPSPKVWKRYLKWQEKNNQAKCIDIDFRNKIDYGWKAHIETFTMKKADNTTVKIDSEIFKNLFYGHNILRPSCYKCPYKSTVHPGDITIADYWGIDKASPGFNDNKGVSLALINNEKGKSIFDTISNSVDYRSCKLEDSLQPPLIKPFPEPIERQNFWKEFNSKSFNHIVKKYANKNISYKIMLYYLKIKNRIFNRQNYGKNN